MTTVRIELTKEDVRRLVLEHINDTYFRSEGTRERSRSIINLTESENGGYIFEMEPKPISEANILGGDGASDFQIAIKEVYNND